MSTRDFRRCPASTFSCYTSYITLYIFIFYNIYTLCIHMCARNNIYLKQKVLPGYWHWEKHSIALISTARTTTNGILIRLEEKNKDWEEMLRLKKYFAVDSIRGRWCLIVVASSSKVNRKTVDSNLPDTSRMFRSCSEVLSSFAVRFVLNSRLIIHICSYPSIFWEIRKFLQLLYPGCVEPLEIAIDVA